MLQQDCLHLSLSSSCCRARLGSTTLGDSRPFPTARSASPRLAGPTRLFVHASRLSSVPALGLNPLPVGWEKAKKAGESKVQKFKDFVTIVFSEFLWLVILAPVLTISWLGFYTIARDIGIPPVFAAGLSAAFDGIAIFAARIGLKHRRKGFSGWLARIVVIAFAALGSFVQSFHAQTHAWIIAHSWIIWATAPIAAVLAYEMHLGWVHRKQLIKRGYQHPSAKSGFGPATWFLIGGTYKEYKETLRARRAFIVTTNLRRFQIEDAAQPQLAGLVHEGGPVPVDLSSPQARLDAARSWYEDEVATDPSLVQEPDHRPTVESVQLIPDPAPSPVFVPVAAVTAPNQILHRDGLDEPEDVHELYDDDPGTPEPAPKLPVVTPIKRRRPEPEPVQEPAPLRRAAERRPAHPAPRSASRPASRSKARPSARPASRSKNTPNTLVADWCRKNGIELGYNNRVPIEGLRAYRKAHPAQSRAS